MTAHQTAGDLVAVSTAPMSFGAFKLFGLGRLSGQLGVLVRLALVLCLLHVGLSAAAEGDFIAVPKLERRVTDLTATLSAADEARIEARLKAYEQAKGAQIAVLIVDTTKPETAFDYSMRVVDAWNLGRKDIDDGVLLLVAKSDRKLEIRTGRGVQGVLTDAASKRIIAEIIAPKFREGNFAEGIYQGVDKIASVIDGEALPPPPKQKKASHSSSAESFIGIAFLAALFVGPLLRSLLGRFMGAAATGGVTSAAAWWLAGGLLFPAVVGGIVFIVVLLMGMMNLGNGRGGHSGGSWGGGFGGGGGSGGGGDSGFSGGGGGFDGGGASGDW
jgi:uncharacterized protein